MDSDEFKALDTLVNEICISRELWEIKAEWETLKKDKQRLQAMNQELLELRQRFEDIDKNAQKLSEPPLQYAVYLGPSPGAESDLVVGLGSARLEVRMKEELLSQLQALRLGQLVLLNEKQNVVAIRSEHVSGETAEVVNIITPEGEAKVLRVIDGDPIQLAVLWRENEEITVTYSQAAAQLAIRPGDFVQVDSEGKLALPREIPRLHVKTAGSEGTVVEMSDRLYAQDVKIGDIVRIEPGLKFAFEKLPAYETGELTLEEVPDVTYDDIGGLDEQIEQIYDAIELPYLYKEKFERYQLTRPKGILLYGPPGCGKTMVAKAVANSLTQNIRNHLKNIEQYIQLYQKLQDDPDNPGLVDQVNALLPPLVEETTPSSPLERFAQLLRQYDIQVERLKDELDKIVSLQNKKDGVRSFFLNVKGPELLDKYVGETEHRIRKIFEVARSHATYFTPVIIFFDEMEAMFRTRGSGRSSDIETTIVPQFLSEIDGVESTSNLIIIGASNRQDMIDPAILRPKRLDVKVKVGRPSRSAAQDIFAMYLLPTLPLNSEGITIAPATDGFGAVVFRTAYPAYYPVDESQPGAKPARSRSSTAGLLPVGCDFRLALSLYPEELDELGKFQAKSIIRDARVQEQEENSLSKKLRRFKETLEIEKLVQCLRTLHKRYAEDAVLHETVEHFVHQEWLAEALLLHAVDLLYGSASMISVLTSKGMNYGLPLKDYMSGAIIANIVDRAKRKALKRVLVEQNSTQEGISVHDLHQGIEQEFTESKEQFAQHKLHAEWGKMDEDIQSVEIFLETGESDPWSEEKLLLYNN